MEFHLLADEHEVCRLQGRAGTIVAGVLVAALGAGVALAAAAALLAGLLIGGLALVAWSGLWLAAAAILTRDGWHMNVTLALTDRRLLGEAAPVLGLGPRRPILYRLVALDGATTEPTRWTELLGYTRLLVSTGDGWDDLGLVPDDREFLRLLQDGIATAESRLERRRAELARRTPKVRRVVRP